MTTPAIQLQSCDPASAIQRMTGAGFTLRLVGDALQVSPADRLSDEQRDFIRDHKAALVAALAQPATPEQEPLTAVQALEALRQAGFTVTAKGDNLIIEPADQLTEMQRAFSGKLNWAMVQLLQFGTLANLKKPEIQTAPDRVCCAECRHSLLSPNTEPVYGWRSCGLDLPRGGGFGQALRRCEQWEVAP